MKLSKIIILLSILVLLPIAGKLHGEGEQIIGLQDAVRLSLENNKKYKISQEKVQESKYKIRETWGMLWPELSSDATFTRYWAEQGLEAASKGTYDLRFIKASLAVNPGVFYNSLRAAHDNNTIVINKEREIKADTTLRAIKLYYKILLAEEMIKVRKDSLKALEEHRRVVSEGYKSGTYTRLDFLRASVAAANEKTKLINAENDAQSARAELNTHMGRNINSPFKINQDEIISDINNEVSFINWSENEKNDKLTTLFTEALKNRPEVVQVTYKKKSEEHIARANEAIYLWPTIFANGSYGETEMYGIKNMPNYPVKNDGSESDTVNASVNAVNKELMAVLAPPGWIKNWNINIGATYKWGALSPIDKSHAVGNQHRSKEKQAALELDDIIMGMDLDIQQGFLKLISASQAIVSQKDNIDSAEESLRIAIIEFKNGAIDATQLLDINAGMSNAKSLYIQALHDFQTAKAELNKSVGYEYFKF